MKDKKVLIVALLAIVIVVLGVVGVNKLAQKRKEAEARDAINKAQELQEQIINQGTEIQKDIINSMVNNFEETNTDIEENHNKRNTIIVILLVSILVVLVILGVNKIYNTSSKEGFLEKIFGNVFSSQENVMSQAQNLFEDITQVGQDLMNNSGFDQDVFNSSYEAYNGTESGWSVKNLIDKIVTNNKKEKDKIITVIYQGVSISEPKELQSLKTNFKDSTQYEVSFEYNENGYIYQTDIMDLN